jgi:hypothetical protein
MDDRVRAALWGAFGLAAVATAPLGGLGPVAILQLLAGLASVAVAVLLAGRAGLVEF